MRERELCRRAAAGDREACAELIRRHYAEIYGLLARLTRDTHQAEDLCQETFAVAWSKLGSFNGRSALKTWLHRIAYHKWIDAGRRQGADEVTYPGVITVSDESGGASDPRAGIESDEQSRLLHEQITRLESAEREVIVLHYLQGLSYRQMADLLDQPAGTVKWRTKLALERLRQWSTEGINHATGDQTLSAGPAAATAPAAAGPAGA